MRRLISPQNIYVTANCTGGSVLIIVLVVCLGLVSVTLVFSNAMLLAYRGEDNELAGRQAQTAIDGAARYAESLLNTATAAAGSTPGTNSLTSKSLTASSATLTTNSLPDPTTYQRSAVTLGPATFWFIGQPQPSDPTDQPVFGLVDESSKLNLNRANAVILGRLPGMTTDLAQAIVAWRTSASAAGGTGTTTQLVLDNSVKAAPFESVEELALVNGGTDLGILYGSDTNLNHCLDAEEGTLAGALGQSPLGLLEYVTVHSRQSNTLSDGTKRVNVNVVGAPGLRDLLTTSFGEARGNELAAVLRSTGGGPGRPPPPPPAFNSPLAFYQAASRAAGMTADEFDQITGKLTASAAAYTTGLVNVNTASSVVLTCVLGDENVAAQLVAARAARTQPSTGLAWVLPIIGQSGVTQAGRFLTGRSYQFSADVAAVGRHGRGYRRTRFVIDTSTGTPQIVYRRDLSALGWALGSTVRQTLAQIVDSIDGGNNRGVTTRP